MSHSVIIYRNVNDASIFAPDNGTYLWSQIQIYFDVALISYNLPIKGPVSPHLCQMDPNYIPK